MKQAGRERVIESHHAGTHRLLTAVLMGLSLLLTACASYDLLGGSSDAAVAGPQGAEEGRTRRQVWRVPSSDPRVLMTTTVWRPPGTGPFPLAVIGHASAQNASERSEDPTQRYEAVALWLLRHGYAVALPIRPGHAPTGGPYLEDQGRCENSDYLDSGRITAASLEAAVSYLTTQPFLRKDRVIVVGQSAGGWGALALASRNPPAVRAVINFAGGRGGQAYDRPNSNCVPDRLVAAAGEFGQTARIPTVWLYTENDSYFGPQLSKQMADAYRSAGGRIDYHLLPPFGDDGHFLMLQSSGIAIWTPIVEKFLARSR
jgi:dienelactone hydrolase